MMMQAFLWVWGVESQGGSFVCTEKGHLWKSMFVKKLEIIL